MADQTRVRNVSPYGDLNVPSLGLVIEYKHEAVIDSQVARSLIESGNFVEVHRASDSSTAAADSAPASSSDGAAAPADQVTSPAVPTTPAADAEEQNQ